MRLVSPRSCSRPAHAAGMEYTPRDGLLRQELHALEQRRTSLRELPDRRRSSGECRQQVDSVVDRRIRAEHA